jgi:SAM-dependent methyltransferase
MIRSASPSGYGLPNAWSGAERRLQLIGQCLDGTTRQRLEAIGVGAGWCCLEVGAGGGSVAALLADAVGPSGRVVATDIDTRFLEGRFVENPAEDRVEVWRHDIVRDPVPDSMFDLIHTRSLLMHLPQREAVIRSLAGALVPGGQLLLEESDFYPVAAMAPEPYRSAWLGVNEALAQAGMDPYWARDLPALLPELGLVDVEADASVAHFTGGSPLAELTQLSFLQLRDRLAPAARAAIDAAVAQLDDPSTWFPGPAVIGVRARRAPSNPTGHGGT